MSEQRRRSWAEPFKIKVVEPLKTTTREYREHAQVQPGELILAKPSDRSEVGERAFVALVRRYLRGPKPVAAKVFSENRASRLPERGSKRLYNSGVDVFVGAVANKALTIYVGSALDWYEVS